MGAGVPTPESGGEDAGVLHASVVEMEAGRDRKAQQRRQGKEQATYFGPAQRVQGLPQALVLQVAGIPLLHCRDPMQLWDYRMSCPK